MIHGKDELHTLLECWKDADLHPFFLIIKRIRIIVFVGRRSAILYFGNNRYIPYQDILRKDLEAAVASHRK